MRETFSDVLVGTIVNMTGRLMDVVPKLAAMGLLVGLGALGAWAVTGIARAALRAAGFDRAAVRWGLWALLLRGGVRRRPSEVLAGALGGATFAFAGLVVLDAVEFPGAGSVTSVILGLLPRALGAAVVTILGFLGGRLGAFGVRLIWARWGWDHADLASGTAAWTVRVVAAGFALAVLGVPPIVILIAPAVPVGLTLLGATLGAAQVARTLGQRAARRWLQSLLLSGRAASPRMPDRAEEPEPAVAGLPRSEGIGVKGFPRFRPSED